jgi:DNA mismatch repair protein MutL
MARIRQLPPNVVTKIAAGEVIERPASVVKELLENSIDAGSTRIDIELDQGGAERIVVVDDGGGIDAEDLELAFASHATSKLDNADDLFRIGTLGFRGEALASIGGVAQVTLQSRLRDREVGSEIRCDGGDLSPIRPWSGSPGTRIEVRHLFYNTPVRKKFLKTIATEHGHVSEALTRLALAYPSLHLTLRHNGKIVYELPATATLPDRIALFFGAELRNALYSIEEQRGPARLYGFVADPVESRGNAKSQYLFLNGRWIRDRSLGHAIQEAYRGLLMVGRYAVAFLFIELPPDQVDVNVHPTKAEVRFRDPSAMFSLVHSAVRARLNRANLVPQLQLPLQPALMPPTPVFSALPPVAFQPSPSVQPNAAPGINGHMSEVQSKESLAFPESPKVPFDAGAFERARNVNSGLVSDFGRALQIHDSYLVLETSEGMLVIDQHALHERILFEQFKRRLQEGAMERQRLLIPEPVDLPAEQAARVLESKAELAELGLEVDGFGGGTVLVQSYPTLLEKLTPPAILRIAVDFLIAKDRVPPREILLNGLMSMMACKAAVKAGDRLTPEQIAALLEQRHLAQDQHHCPHGRPTSLIFSRHELDKQFGRI